MLKEGKTFEYKTPKVLELFKHVQSVANIYI